VQGVLYYAGTASSNPSDMLVIREGICEFKGRSNIAQTPLLRTPKIEGGSDNNASAEIGKKKDESTAVVIGGVTYLRSKA